MTDLPCQVLIHFGAPIEPRRTSYVKGPAVTDPPLNQDSLPGTLSAWQKREDGWWGMVTYGYPTHGLGWGRTSTGSRRGD